MAMQSLPVSTTEANPRVLRALTLYEEHGHEIEKIAPDIYLVPSQDGKRFYRAQYGKHEFCSYPDHNYRGVSCVHIFAVGILNAKRRLVPCSGCGGRFPARELIELHEDNHDNLTYFHGDLLCRECANAAGVIL